MLGHVAAGARLSLVDASLQALSGRGFPVLSKQKHMSADISHRCE